MILVMPMILVPSNFFDYYLFLLSVLSVDVVPMMIVVWVSSDSADYLVWLGMLPVVTYVTYDGHYRCWMFAAVVNLPANSFDLIVWESLCNCHCQR